MPTKNYHVILRNRIEVTIDKHSDNKILQHTIHNAVQKRIMPILSKLFSQYIPQDVVIHLDKLVIDGGSFNLSTLDKQLPSQVEQILTLKLKEQITKVMNNPTLHQVIPLPDAQRQAIAHYLSEGHFAWWMIERSEKQIEKIYLELLHHTPLLIEQLWFNLTKKEKAIQRCITLFSRTTLEHTLARLLKQPIPYFKAILAEAGLLLHQTKILNNLLYTPEQQLLSMAILGIIHQQKTKVDRMGFLNMLLKQVALQTSISYEKILEKLQAYYAQNEGKSACDQSTKALVLQLRDMVVTPPKFWYQDLKNQEKVLKKLDQIGNSTMAFYQLSAVINSIKTEIDKPGIHHLVKSWLQEETNRKKLIKTLPDKLFISLLQSIDSDIALLFSDFTGIVAATTATRTPACAIKAITLAYYAFEHSKTLYFEEIKSLFRKYISNGLINKDRFAALFATPAYTSEVKTIMVPLVSTAALPPLPDATKTKMNQNGIPDLDQPLCSPTLAYLLERPEPITRALLKDILLEKLFEAPDLSAPRDKPLTTTHKAWLTQILHSPTIAKQIDDILQMVDTQDRKMKINQLIPIIQRSLAEKIPISPKLLGRLETVIIKLLKTTEPQQNIHSIQNIFIRSAMVDTPITEKEYIERIVDYLAPYTPFSSRILCDRLSTMAAKEAYPHLAKHFTSLALLKNDKINQHQDKIKYHPKSEPIVAFETKDYTNHLDNDPISVPKNSLSDVADFLAYNELPKDQLVPAYLIAKCLAKATPKQIRDQLAPLCQEGTVLKKLIQHATEITLSKLFQAFIPFSNEILDRLERVMMQSKVLQSIQKQAKMRLIKEIFITSAIIHKRPTTEKQYIARILLHLSAQASCPPTIVCDQLIDAATETTDCDLVEAFSLLKESLAPLNVNKIDEVDLIFLSTHETFGLAKSLLPLYHNRLIPAIKKIVREADDISQSLIAELVRKHLPTIPNPLEESIAIALYKEITDTLESKKERITQRWYLFLHTGKLGNYSDGTALLNDVMAHLATFPLGQDKTHVRQRLIANFTHVQLMLLVQRHSNLDKSLTNFIQGSYQLWCATQSSLGQQNITKNLFWDSVLKTLPQTSIAQDDWLAQITTELSKALEITPTTLLQTFQLLIQDTKGIPEVEGLAASLNSLQARYQQGIQQQAIQRGYKEPILTKLYLLLNGNLSFFAQQYHLGMDALGKELMQFIADQPFALSKFLEAQENHQLIPRRIVHYFSREVATKIIAYLAKDNYPFVMHYLDLLSNVFQDGTTQLHDPSTWQKELYISIIHYLITKSHFQEKDFVHSTLLTICYSKETIYKIISSIIYKKYDNQEKKKIITLLNALIKIMNKAVTGPPTLTNNRLEEISLTRQKEPSPKVRLPEEEVRVYTNNSGLVFLWPFFYDFFKSNNLMVGNQFLSNQAAHNGVYLLQYLVTGKLKSPEWQLTLPKLLCGLPYDEVLLPYKPIDKDYDPYSDEEEEREKIPSESGKQRQEEVTAKIESDGSIPSSTLETITVNSELLIEKVIKRWKSLAKLKETASYQDCTTDNVLKSYFLNRLGILTRQEGDHATENKSWHLTIMHQDHDNANLLPPWSINSLKLPWMQEEIILFWMAG